MASTDVVFSDEARAKQAFQELRSNDHPSNWVLFTYSDSAKNTLDFIGSGNGGVEELKGHLNETKSSYGLVRVTDKIDNSVTVKFVFIFWCGEKVPFVKKAQITTHKGSVSALVGQYHNDVFASNLDELSESIIMSKVRDASGTAQHVKDSPVSHSQQQHQQQQQQPSPSVAHSSPSAAPKITSSKQPSVPKATTSNVNFVDEENIRNAIKAVRANNDETDWMLMGYEGSTNNIVLVAKGTGDLDELITHLKDDQILYGLYRTTDTIDNTVAVKFVLIVWVGEKVPIIRKARITTHKGDITSFLGQYHVDVHCSNLSEINEDIVKDLVQRASGTANLVKK
jgi:hypothetical protein